MIQFTLRLAAILLPILAALFHPAVILPGDLLFLIQAFGIYPLATVLGFWSAGVKFAASSSQRVELLNQSRRRVMRSLGILLAVSAALIPVAGTGSHLFSSMGLALGAFGVSVLGWSRVWPAGFLIEQAVVSAALLRLVALGRGLQEQNSGYTALLFALLFASAVIALLISADRSRRTAGKSGRRRAAEWTTSVTALSAAAILLALVLPSGFVENARVPNNLSDIFQPNLRPADGQDGRDGQPQGSEGQVYISSADSWGNGRGGEDGESRQYMVMIVESDSDPLYLADRYWGVLDAIDGFTADTDIDLNRLPNQRFIETWTNPAPAQDQARTRVDYKVFSTIDDSVLSYEPYTLEPTVYDPDWYPLNYRYQASSRISMLSLYGVFPKSNELSESEASDLAEYLEIDLPPELEERYRSEVDSIIAGAGGYMERIVALLQHFETYQYELGFTDNVSSAAVADFYFNTLTGDCTEFSNSAALVARMAGIPSRVVTGYLVDSGLQTDNHRQALSIIASQYPPLADSNPANLYLVTTAHRHSWPQFYVPGYGWVDFEPTSFAIPPAAEDDPNSMDIVIPDLYRQPESRDVVIPWMLILSWTGGISLTALILALCLRWYRLLRLSLAAGGSSFAGREASYRMLLLQMRAAGLPTKEPGETEGNYALRIGSLCPAFGDFAELYRNRRFAPEVVAPASGATESGAIGAGSADVQLDSARKAVVQSLGNPLIVGVRLLFGLRNTRYLP